MDYVQMLLLFFCFGNGIEVFIAVVDSRVTRSPRRFYNSSLSESTRVKDREILQTRGDRII